MGWSKEDLFEEVTFDIWAESSKKWLFSFAKCSQIPAPLSVNLNMKQTSARWKKQEGKDRKLEWYIHTDPIRGLIYASKACSEKSEEEIPTLRSFDESPVANCYQASHRHDISLEIWVDFTREMLLHLNNTISQSDFTYWYALCSSYLV